MTHSFAATANMTCPTCEQQVQVELWLIVDIEERPDLLDKLREGTLQNVKCPQCGHGGGIDAPLLIVMPTQKPPPMFPSIIAATTTGTNGGLIFSPANQGTREMNQQNFNELRNMLQEEMGEAWQSQWIEQMQSVPKHLLRIMFAKDPAAAQQERVALILQSLSSPLSVALGKFTMAPSWHHARLVLNEHPELLSDEADRLLNLRMAGEEDPLIIDVFAEHQQLLHRCRESGSDEAFAEKATSLNRSGAEALSIPTQISTLLRTATEKRFIYYQTNDLASLETAADVWEQILNKEEFASLSELLRLHFYHQAATIFTLLYQSRKNIIALTRAVYLWEEAASMTAAESPNLLPRLFNLGSGLHSRYHHHGRDLDDLGKAINTFRQVVQAAPENWPNLPPTFSHLGNALIARFEQEGITTDLDEAISLCRHAIAITAEDAPYLPTRLSYLATGLYKRYHQVSNPDDLEESITLFKQAALATPENSPNLPLILSTLARAIRSEYTQTRRLPDVEIALHLAENAAAAVPKDSPYRPYILSGLREVLRDRAQHIGSLEEVEERLKTLEQEENTLDKSLGVLSNNLGLLLQEQFCVER